MKEMNKEFEFKMPGINRIDSQCSYLFGVAKKGEPRNSGPKLKRSCRSAELPKLSNYT